jgi:hypothetical protein
MKWIFGLWAAFCKFHVKQMVLECLFIFFAIPRYALLVGYIPFETHSSEDIYSKIKKNEFHDIRIRLVLLSSKCFKQILVAGKLNFYLHFFVVLFIKSGFSF